MLVIQLQIEDKGIFCAVVVLFIDVVEDCQNRGQNVDGPAICKEVVIILFDVAVLLGTAAFYFAEDVALEKTMGDIGEVIPNFLIEFLDPVQPSHPVEPLMRSRLDQGLLFALSHVDKQKLNFRVDQTKLFDHLVGLLQKLLEFRLQLDVPHWQPLEYLFNCHLGTSVFGTLAVGQMKIKFA